MTVRSSWNCIASDCVRLVPGIRSACTARSPSSRLGMNSDPRRVASQPQKATNASAPIRNGTRSRSAAASTGVYSRLALRTMRFSFSSIRPLSKSATAAGTNVRDSTSAARSAMITASAIGRNIFPSTPVRARIGRLTRMTTSTLTRLGVKTSRVAAKTVWKRSSMFNSRLR